MRPARLVPARAHDPDATLRGDGDRGQDGLVGVEARGSGTRPVAPVPVKDERTHRGGVLLIAHGPCVVVGGCHDVGEDGVASEARHPIPRPAPVVAAVDDRCRDRAGAAVPDRPEAVPGIGRDARERDRLAPTRGWVDVPPVLLLAARRERAPLPVRGHPVADRPRDAVAEDGDIGQHARERSRCRRPVHAPARSVPAHREGMLDAVERREADRPCRCVTIGRHGHQAILGAAAAGLDVLPAGGRVADDHGPAQVVAHPLEPDAPGAARREGDPLE